MQTSIQDLSESAALSLDDEPDQTIQRDRFWIPEAEGGSYRHAAYLAGNSLGLQPRATAEDLTEDLAAWAQLAVRGHLDAARPWFPYHQLLTEYSARLVGAIPDEVVVMNSLTVNLHLLLASFYRPTGERHCIVIEDHAFSSDSYAVRSHVALRGHDPDEAVLRIAPRPGEDVLRDEDVVAFIEKHGSRIATVLLGAVNYRTGEFLDLDSITATAHRVGAFAGWDLAHAAGNVPLRLHDWSVDFAAWCTYKYLNSGPGAVAGAFIHQRHLGKPDIPRLAGWWSHRPETRFEMNPILDLADTADAWALSNPPILAMGPVRTSLEIFDEIGMTALRERSLRLTGYLLALLDGLAQRCPITVVTPRDPERRGAQVSIRVPADADSLTERMHRNWGVTADDRRPDIVRMAPAPLYNTFHDAWRGADALSRELTGRGLE